MSQYLNVGSAVSIRLGVNERYLNVVPSEQCVELQKTEVLRSLREPRVLIRV